jgi:hypothetical protein
MNASCLENVIGPAEKKSKTNQISKNNSQLLIVNNSLLRVAVDNPLPGRIYFPTISAISKFTYKSRKV